MRGKFLKKLLALSLSAAMVLGNAAPVWATEQTAAESEQTETPTVTLNVDEDGNVDGIYVQNNDEEYGRVCYGLATEEKIESGEFGYYSYDWLDSSEAIWGASLSNMIDSQIYESGTYYIVAYAECENKARSELIVLADYPITAEISSMKETLEYQIGDVTGYGYFSDKPVTEYAGAEVVLLVTDEDGTFGYSEELSVKNDMFYLDIPLLEERYKSWLFLSATLYKIDADKTGCTVVRENYGSAVKGGAFEETRTEAPTLTLDTDDDGSISYLVVKNNDEDYSCIRYGLATKEEIETGTVECNSGSWNENSEKSWINLKDLITGDVSESGEYYITAYAENENEVRSEAVVMESFPITVTITSMEGSLAYQPGKLSGCMYFTEISAEEYDYAEARVFVTDEWDDSWITHESLEVKDGLFFLNTQEYAEYYETWRIEEIELFKFDATESGCTATRELYTAVTEGEAYEEARAEAPTVTINDEGWLVVKNNDEDYSCVYYGVATAEEIETGVVDYYSYEWLENSESVWGAMLSGVIWTQDEEEGEYYIVAYAENESEIRSELFVLDNYPIEVSITQKEEPVEYRVGDFTGYAYFTEKTEEDYFEAEIELFITDEWDNSWYTGWTLSTQNEMFYFNIDQINEEYKEWNIETVKFFKMKSADKGCTVETEIYSSVIAGDVFEEPKAAAPTMKLHKDDKGNVIGVAITNNVTHDDVELNYGCYGETGSSTRWKSVNAGETVIVLFEKLHLPNVNHEEETITFQCRAYDYANGIYSETVILDYPITVETEEYSGENITVYVETNDEGWKWYYVDADQLPENDSEWYGWNSQELMDEGYRQQCTFEQTEDGTHLLIDGVNGFELTKMETNRTAADENGVKFIRYQIPQEKITLKERELRSKEVLLLDYDYYNAFIASGGSVTINENAEVEISTEKFTSEDKWTLEYLYQEFVGTELYTLILNIADTVKEWANQYWKSEEGSFAAVNYYDTEGNLIAEESINEHDVVLIEYAPEIVWVDSMELTAPEKMEPKGTAMVTAALDAGQDKYPFGRKPQIRYESDRPEVVAVDAQTGKLTAGTVNGTATITAYADEKLRAEEGLKEIVTASVTITVQAKEEPKTPVTEVFDDIAGGSWYIDAVQYVYDSGIMSGSKGLFKPTGNITREQVVATLYNLEGTPKVTDYSAVNKLKDLKAGQWYTDAVCWAYNTGVATGNASTKLFSIGQSITRQQLAMMLYNYAEYKGFDTETRGDYSSLKGANEVASYAVDAMKWAYGTGLISGSKTVINGTAVYDLKPTGTATRAQMASILMNFCEKNQI